MRRMLSLVVALALILCCLPAGISAVASEGKNTPAESSVTSALDQAAPELDETETEQTSGELQNDHAPGVSQENESSDRPQEGESNNKPQDSGIPGNPHKVVFFKSTRDNLLGEEDDDSDDDEDQPNPSDDDSDDDGDQPDPSDDDSDDDDDQTDSSDGEEEAESRRDDGTENEGEPSDVQEVSSIQMPAPAVPAAGKTVSAYGSSCEAYSLSGSWLRDGSPVSSGSTFQAGCTYVLQIFVRLHENYQYSSGVKAYVGGSEKPVQWSGTNAMVRLTYALPKEDPEDDDEKEIENWTWGNGFTGFSLSLTGTYTFSEVCARLPQSILSEGQQIAITWSCPGYQAESGTYWFTGSLPEGYELDDDARPIAIAVKMTAEEQQVTYDPVGEVKPTCETDGMKEHYQGSDGKYYIDSESGEKVPVSAESLILKKLGHLWKLEYKWEKDGSRCEAVRTCERDETHCETSVATVTSSITREPTEEQMGETTFTAVFHDAWAQGSEPVTKVLTNIPVKPHVHKALLIPGTPATEEESGLKDYYHCEGCGKNFEDADCSLEIQDLDSWRVIPRKEHVHQLEHVAEKKATCQEQGIAEHWHCESCGKNFEDPEGLKELGTVITEKLDHSYSRPVYSWSDDGRICTVERTCSLCGVKEQAEGTVEARRTRAPGCTTRGQTTYTATFTEDWAETVQVTHSDIAPLGHSWGQVTYTWSGDSTGCTAQRECQRNPGHRETATAVISLKKDSPGIGMTTVTAAFPESWAQTQTRILETAAPEKKTPEEPQETEPREEPFVPVLPDDMHMDPGDDCFRILIEPAAEQGLHSELSLDTLKDIRRKIAENGRASGLAVACGSMAVTYDLHALDSILDQAEGAAGIAVAVEPQQADDGTLTRAQQDTVAGRKNGTLYSVELSLLMEDRQQEIHDFDGGTARITVPCESSFLRSMKAYRVEEDGSLTELPCDYQQEDGAVTFETTSHSHYMVVSVLNLITLAWLTAGIMMCVMFVVMFRNRRGYLTED